MSQVDQDARLHQSLQAVGVGDAEMVLVASGLRRVAEFVVGIVGNRSRNQRAQHGYEGLRFAEPERDVGVEIHPHELMVVEEPAIGVPVVVIDGGSPEGTVGEVNRDDMTNTVGGDQAQYLV